MMQPEAIRQLISQSLPNSQIEVEDTTGTLDHFQVLVISPEFQGKTLVEQHQMVYRALGDAMKEAIHALALKTYSPEEKIMSDAQQTIAQQIKDNKIFIYMKGNKHFPQCGFSAAVVDVFNRLGVPYETFDVLSDPEIRDGVKSFSNWPTIPQVYIDGKFIGGCDIVREMYTRGELQPLVQAAVAK